MTRRRSSHSAAWLCAGTIVALASVSPPVDDLSDRFFSMHMIQHEVLMIVAAPLFVVSGVLHWSFRLVPRRFRRGTVHALSAVSEHPFRAAAAHGAAIWAWHMPAPFDAASNHPAVHALQHGSFFGTALLFWWSVLRPRRRAYGGSGLVALFLTAVQTAVLGALLTFSRFVWYRTYAGRPDALTDQQLAGVVMWVPAGASYLAAAIVVARRWLADSESRVRRIERASPAGIA